MTVACDRDWILDPIARNFDVLHVVSVWKLVGRQEIFILMEMKILSISAFLSKTYDLVLAFPYQYFVFPCRFHTNMCEQHSIEDPKMLINNSKSHIIFQMWEQRWIHGAGLNLSCVFFVRIVWNKEYICMAFLKKRRILNAPLGLNEVKNTNKCPACD
jgi:hypothetical protein